VSKPKSPFNEVQLPKDMSPLFVAQSFHTECDVKGHIETYPAAALPSWEGLSLHDFSSRLLRTPDTLTEISLTIRCIFCSVCTLSLSISSNTWLRSTWKVTLIARARRVWRRMIRAAQYTFTYPVASRVSRT
jgi:hypothetical protein